MTRKPAAPSAHSTIQQLNNSTIRSSPTTAELAAWDHDYLWHPFTQMQEWLAEPPLVIERGEGNYLIDTEGRRYLDGVSSLWCNVHGHRKRGARRGAARRSATASPTRTMLGLANVPATVLAKRLVELTPASLTRVFYSDAGATAVEIALKLALQYWQLRGQSRRTRFVALTEAYHGDTLGAVSRRLQRDVPPLLSLGDHPGARSRSAARLSLAARRVT